LDCGKRKPRLGRLPVLAAAVALLAIMGMAASVSAAAYYVSPDGSDSNPGTSQGAPWKTLAPVNRTAFRPGDFVSLRRGGLWRETLAPKNGGSPGNPVTCTASGSGAK